VRHDNNEPEERIYLCGNISEYHVSTLSFMPNDKWEDPGKHIGIRIESGSGDVLVHSIELYELPENAAEPTSAPQNIDDFLQYGDVYENGNCLVLNGQGAALAKRVVAKNDTYNLQLEYKASGTGQVSLNNQTMPLPPTSEWAQIAMSATDTKTLDINIQLTCGSEMQLRNISSL